MSQITGRKKERKKKEETKQIRHCNVWSARVVVIVRVLGEGEDKTKESKNLLLISWNVQKKSKIYHLIKSNLLDNDNGTKK